MTHPDWKAYAEATAARPGEAAALAERALRPRRRWAPWVVVALAAVALALWLWPSPPYDVELAEEPVTVGRIQVVPDGSGRLSGQGKEATIEWTTGHLEVVVEHGRGMRVAVRTPEALVRVVGTRFTVERTALGTSVSVESGRVQVTCADGTAAGLEVGQAHDCWPIDPVDLLGRTVALARAGASDDDVLATVDRGLAAAPDPVVEAEFRAWRAITLVNLGRVDEAREEALRYIADPNAPRRAEVAAATGLDP